MQEPAAKSERFSLWYELQGLAQHFSLGGDRRVELGRERGGVLEEGAANPPHQLGGLSTELLSGVRGSEPHFHYFSTQDGPTCSDGQQTKTIN